MSATRSFSRAFNTSASSTTSTFRQSSHRPIFRSQFQRRTQSTASGAVASDGQSAFTKYWNSPVGPKTVHFWAPIMKWGIVLAGVSDFAKPASALSLNQNLALMATGAIWTRWCFIIKPRNVFLATVNFFLFCVGAAQATRVFLYRRSLADESLGEQAKDGAKDVKQTIEGIVKDPKGAVNKATNI